MRRYNEGGLLVDETHSYGKLDIALQRMLEGGVKTAECYFANRRMVSRKTYEARRIAYPDMPPADTSVEDFGGNLMSELRAQQRSNKAEAGERLRQSEESRFLRPESTNWLRVIAGERAHLVEFASRDWKILGRERDLRTGREWLDLFGFRGPPTTQPSIHKGCIVGYEVAGDREAMLDASKRLLAEVAELANKPPEPKPRLDSFAPRPKTPKKRKPLAWLFILPPLIEFLSGLKDSSVKIFNHHQ